MYDYDDDDDDDDETIILSPLNDLFLDKYFSTIKINPLLL